MRKNVVAWNDCDVITRKMGQLQDQIVKYAPYSGAEHVRAGTLGQGKLDGDSSVIVAAIELRTYLTKIIEKSTDANRK